MNTSPRNQGWIWTAIIVIAGLASCFLGATALVLLALLLRQPPF